MSRVDVCKNMINRNICFTETISCVFFENIECGMCFSCFDKLSGILIAIAELGKIKDINLVTNNGIFCLMLANVKLMTFRNNINSFNSLEKLPIDYIMLIQLNRIILREDIENIISSKYSLKSVLKLLYYYSKHRVGDILVPKTCALYKKYEINCREILKIV